MIRPPCIPVVRGHRAIRDAPTRRLQRNGFRADAAARPRAMDRALAGATCDLIASDLKTSRVKTPGEDKTARPRHFRPARVS